MHYQAADQVKNLVHISHYSIIETQLLIPYRAIKSFNLLAFYPANLLNADCNKHHQYDSENTIVKKHTQHTPITLNL